MGHSRIVELLLHPQEGIARFFGHYGPWAYAIIFLIVFCETGLVVTPFLPGDSLLFATGMVARGLPISPILICLTLICAALLGDNVNYFLGCRYGRRLFHNENSKFFNRKSLEKTHAFFEKYGGRTVIIARFLPLFRTFAPFVAGMGRMPYRLFITYSAIAAFLWVALCFSIGYFAGGSPWAKENFSLMLMALVVLSAIPGILEFYRHWREAKREKASRLAGEEETTVADATTEIAI
jgi:membrane-associated protein